MSLYRDGLPQLSNGVFLTDGGIETDLVFHQGVDLPYGAAYVLLEDEAGVARLTRYFDEYLDIARAEYELDALRSPDGDLDLSDEMVAEQMFRKIRAHGILREFTACTVYFSALKEAGAEGTAIFWFHRAYFYYYLGNFRRAVRSMQEAAKLAPDNREALANRLVDFQPFHMINRSISSRRPTSGPARGSRSTY